MLINRNKRENGVVQSLLNRCLHPKQNSSNGESGTTLVEYSLILVLVSMAGLVGLVLMADQTQILYEYVRQAAEAMADAVA